MNEYLNEFCLLDLLFIIFTCFCIGVVVWIFMGVAMDRSNLQYKRGQLSCVVCEVRNNAQ